MFIAAKKNRAFTLVELLIAVSVGLLISSVLIVVLVKGLENIRRIRDRERLHSNITFILNSMHYWVKQSQKLVTPDNTILQIVMPDLEVKDYREQDGALIFDGAATTDSDIRVEQFDFKILARSVRISLSLVSTRNPDIKLSVTTTIAQRNQ